jgi:transposase InsO family protein
MPVLTLSLATSQNAPSDPRQLVPGLTNRKLKAIDVIDTLSDLFILRGIPGHIRSDNGPEFVAKAVQEWITAVGDKTAFIEPHSPWENDYIESFNARRRRRRQDRRQQSCPRFDQAPQSIVGIKFLH